MEKRVISVVAVNYNSSGLLKNCFSSLSSAVGREGFEFIAVDSGSREEEIKALHTLRGDNVTKILAGDNIGYARAVNMGIEKALSEYILITNPDVLYKPESMHSMVRALKEIPRCGAVGPRTWWNEQMTFLLSYSEPVTPGRILAAGVMRNSPAMNDLLLRRWIKKMIRFWLSDTPSKQETLSGACMMTTRKMLDKIGGFDETFSLYFEDTDWCLRVRKAGYRLYLVPDSTIIHYYNQSAMQEAPASHKKFSDSFNMYIRKHFSKHQVHLMNTMMKFFRGGADTILKGYEEKGSIFSPPVFSFNNRARKLFLLSPVDILIPSAGSFFEGDTFAIPGDLWERLGEGRYYAKVFDLARNTLCGSWSWVKNLDRIGLEHTNI